MHTSYFNTVDFCDSIITTQVYVYPMYDIAEEVTICNGEAYTFPDGSPQSNINSTVIYVSNLLTVNGCDSIITTTVNVNPVYNQFEVITICSGEDYIFPDGSIQENITANLTYASKFVTIQGCDSTITTSINVNPAYNLSETDSVCCGDSFTFPDGSVQHNIDTTVIYVSNLITINGCDSIITTKVFVEPDYNIPQSVTLCSGSSYTFPDGNTLNNITATITYVSNFETVYGCDSLVTTTVNINPVYNITEQVSICSGESYTFPDGTTRDNIISSLSHTSNLVTIDGCDSIIVTNIDIAEVDVSVIQSGETLTSSATDADYQWID
jgi:hypothetical protein